MKNVIYRGPLDAQPHTVTAAVAGAYLPGTAVSTDGAEFTQLTAGGDARVLILSNREFYTQTTMDAYDADETAHAYRPRVEDDFAVAMAAGTYAVGDPLMIGASGRFTAATSGNRVIAYFDDAPGAVTTGSLSDVVIAGGYVKA